MASRENGITRRLKDVISEPTPNQLIEIMKSAATVINTHPIGGDTPPTLLVNAMRAPAGRPQTVVLGLLDMTLVIVVLPSGETNPDRDHHVWSSILGRFPEWRSLKRTVNRLHREVLPPEIGGITLREPNNEELLLINEELPHKRAIEVVRALRLPALGLAVVLAGKRLVGQAARRHPTPAMLTLIAATATIAVPTTSLLANNDDRQPPAARPATQVTVFRASPGPTVTSPAPTVTVTVSSSAALDPVAVSTRTRHRHRKSITVHVPHPGRATGSPSMAAISSLAPSPIPVPVDSPVADSILTTQPTAALTTQPTPSPPSPPSPLPSPSAAPTPPQQVTPPPSSCSGIGLDVDVPLTTVDICIG